MCLTTFLMYGKLCLNLGEIRSLPNFPKKIPQIHRHFSFPRKRTFVDEIHRGDQYGCLTHFFSNFLGILMGFRGHVNKIPIFSQSPIDPPPRPHQYEGIIMGSYRVKLVPFTSFDLLKLDDKHLWQYMQILVIRPKYQHGLNITIM